MKTLEFTLREEDLLKRIVQEMRDEHDRGDGHFTTEEVEFMELFISEMTEQDHVS